MIGFNCTWASGGGRSALRLAGEVDDIVTAGGGGGGGYSSNGGAGGGLIGASGGPAEGATATGGTQVAGGAGGLGNEPGHDGVQHLGGPAGLDLDVASEGGGGGGGWYGGGGGGNNGGGGGGSSRISFTGLSDGCTVAGNGRTSGAVSASAVAAPTLSGTAGIGAMLTAHSGTWTCHLTRHFQWQTSSDGSNWTDVGSATAATYTITSTGLVRVLETAVNPFGSGVTQSAAMAITVDSSLADLTVSTGTLTPAFSPTVFDYTVTVPNATTTVSVTPTRNDAATTLTVDDIGVASGSPSGPITLTADTTTISVLASNTGMVTTTSVVVVRLPVPSSPPPQQSPVLPPAAPSTTSTPPSTRPPGSTTTTPTTMPVANPPNAVAPQPVPTPQGSLPALVPGTALLIADGRTQTLESFVEGGTDFVTQLSDLSFGLRLSAQCGTAACPLATTPDGRLHVRAAPGGTVTIEGYGFRPGTLVHVWIFSTPRFLGSLGVASDGTFLGVLPLGPTPEGEHTLQANGIRDDGVEQSVNLGLSISPGELVARDLPSTGPSALEELALAGVVATGAGLTLVGRRRRAPLGRPSPYTQT